MPSSHLVDLFGLQKIMMGMCSRTLLPKVMCLIQLPKTRLGPVLTAAGVQSCFAVVIYGWRFFLSLFSCSLNVCY